VLAANNPRFTARSYAGVRHGTTAVIRRLEGASPDAMGNALVELEASFPFNIGLPTGTTAPQGAPLFGIGRALYFCIPRNERMLQYWDTVGDRLFKVRIA